MRAPSAGGRPGGARWCWKSPARPATIAPSSQEAAMKPTLLLSLILALLLPTVATAGKSKKDHDDGYDCVDVCHVPKGKHDKAREACLREGVAMAHIEKHEHDYLGECEKEDDDRDDDCVEVCHVPYGNRDNAHTICVGKPAVKAHVGRHGGDFLGRCEKSRCADECEDAFADCKKGEDGFACEQELALCRVLCACEEGCCQKAARLCLDSKSVEPGVCLDSRDACLRGADCLFCGDGYVDAAAGEECDDGNEQKDDGCADCRLEDVIED
jgi:cysteine-rich repeat protein